MRKSFKSAFTLIELLVVIAIIAIVCGLLAGFVGGCNKSDGSRTGRVIKFSKKGNFSKTWEGELAQTESLVWLFTCPDDPELVGEVERAKNSGQRVSLHYQQKRFANPASGDTSYRITKVQFLEGGQSALIPNATPPVPKRARDGNLYIFHDGIWKMAQGEQWVAVPGGLPPPEVLAIER